MKAGRSVDGIVYPDVGQQISDPVSQQPGESEVPRIKEVVPRKRVDEVAGIQNYRNLQMIWWQTPKKLR
jgi:hypothetical protein